MNGRIRQAEGPEHRGKATTEATQPQPTGEAAEEAQAGSAAQEHQGQRMEMEE